MNDPNEPYGPYDPYEATETHIERLLGRALNSFELPDATVEQLGSALAHASSLHSSHHSASLHRATYRHAYLLGDGSSLVLWELVHNTGRDGTDQHELYAEESEARLAASRLPAGFPGFAGTGGAAGPGSALGQELGVDLEDELDAGLELLAALMAPPPAPLPPMYVPDNSADHARRLLRRAENDDRPGEETARLLRAAFAHHITQVFGRQFRVAGKDAGFTLYEHAFLLLDGTERSLWEVEHTATPDGRHMCEVYEAEHDARAAMELRTRVR
ncbi:DUF6227 family protein [Streptomyces peucetius]|uniref:DUF6227 family protein n=1 Tax=Streptomyces peucetius TaxID=1950 RepID=A0ABY6I6P2_STRPE|nr:DUF6227 family protein [Streptomyces peucetius]UYQ62669.1 DUF6227 family protein [Streptomyces peucetius]